MIAALGGTTAKPQTHRISHVVCSLTCDPVLTSYTGEPAAVTVSPLWIVDCAAAGCLLPTGEFALEALHRPFPKWEGRVEGDDEECPVCITLGGYRAQLVKQAAALREGAREGAPPSPPLLLAAKNLVHALIDLIGWRIEKEAHLGKTSLVIYAEQSTPKYV